MGSWELKLRDKGLASPQEQEPRGWILGVRGTAGESWRASQLEAEGGNATGWVWKEKPYPTQRLSVPTPAPPAALQAP